MSNLCRVRISCFLSSRQPIFTARKGEKKAPGNVTGRNCNIVKSLKYPGLLLCAYLFPYSFLYSCSSVQAVFTRSSVYCSTGQTESWNPYYMSLSMMKRNSGRSGFPQSNFPPSSLPATKDIMEILKWTEYCIVLLKNKQAVTVLY